MTTAEPPVLLIPGWNNSGPDHWQTHWEQTHNHWQRVEQDSWDYPEPSAWVQSLDAAITNSGAPPILVAHSLGAITVAMWAARSPQAHIAGALLVAPPDVEGPNTPPEVRSFAPIPLTRLPFRSVLVASRNDPYLSFRRARLFSESWGAELYDAGHSGHLNAESGFGPWPEGERLAAQLLQGRP